MEKSIDFEKEKSDAKWEISILILLLADTSLYMRIFSSAAGNIMFFLLPPLLIWLVACIWCQVLIKKQPEKFFQPIFQIRRVSFHLFEIAFLFVFAYIFFFFHVPALNLFS